MVQSNTFMDNRAFVNIEQDLHRYQLGTSSVPAPIYNC